MAWSETSRILKDYPGLRREDIVQLKDQKALRAWTKRDINWTLYGLDLAYWEVLDPEACAALSAQRILERQR